MTTITHITTKKIKLDEGHIAYWDSMPMSDSDFRTIVFLHGHVSSKKIFSNQITSLSLKDYRLICIDFPGYGESDVPNDEEKVYSWPGFADIVTQFIQSLNLKNLIVVGWSLGGHVGLELTSRLAQLKGLLITGTPPIPISAEGFNRGFHAADPTVQSCFGKGSLTLEESILMAKGAGYDGSKERQYILDDVINTHDSAKIVYPQSILRGIGQSGIDIVRVWPNPIAVIAGKNDPFINNAYIIHEVPFKNLWKNQVFLIEKASHAISIEAPNEFNEFIKKFSQDVFST